MGQTTTPPYTAAEYLALEAASEVRHEYYRGEIFAMSGTSGTHNMVKQNCVKPPANAAGKRLPGV